MERRTLPAVISLSAKEEEVLKRREAAVLVEAEVGPAATGEWEVVALIRMHREMASEIGTPEMGFADAVDMEEETCAIRVVPKAVEGIVAAGLDAASVQSLTAMLICCFVLFIQ
ncbi:hypothetical protein Y032_0585g319 [Ancylostoma ceylanicum]|uniref:Uncharacterized protein n=1 Tax=Ancylostoma ceylanicum TaxID=53326 RepID=A0A016WMJ9_9BILA|nr:hypothetical protein Y032_0585g319 [Ancylostoma ceylanicum]